VADVLIIVGSESDKPRIEPAFEVLSKAGRFVRVPCVLRPPAADRTADLVKGARKKASGW